jgi:hypothetical protein
VLPADRKAHAHNTWGTWGVFDTPALEGLASEPGSGQPELDPERSEGLFDVFAPTEPS